ncbi:DUF5313 family protein [Amycolatopsis jiangsuensis]|uniref:DUF5313 family protein n=1 Tax=Amycolatopsis jiangsuensis TaxID=1181879 RepID=A0A840IU34_9PSEU|nr:DUF5313 family protein [Amycolatopsis jiangsuensis]MBB4685039.1 hypothetical protein [Amycolatopsis jiangsuensis]
MARKRPGPLRWLHYVYGGRLPDDYREWVLYDATAKTWQLRFALRIVAEALPWLVVAFLLLTLLTPLPVPVVLLALLLSLLLSLFLTVTSADELAEVRLTKHGFPPGTGKLERKRRGRPSVWP